MAVQPENAWLIPFSVVSPFLIIGLAVFVGWLYDKVRYAWNYMIWWRHLGW